MVKTLKLIASFATTLECVEVCITIQNLKNHKFFILVAISESVQSQRTNKEEIGQTCLCLGFFEQMTYILPFLRTTKQPSQNFFTLLLTFIPLT